MSLPLERRSWRVSRIYTSKVPIRYLSQLPLWWVGRDVRRWAIERLRLRVVDNDEGRYCRRDVNIYSRIVRQHHYLSRWPVPPKKKLLAYLADMDGCQPGPAGAAGMALFSLIASNCILVDALKASGHEIHNCEVLTLVRCWRADDLGPDLAPYLTPHMLSRIIRGHHPSGLEPLAHVWERRKCTNGLRARPRLVITYADPEIGHDGGLYLAAGAVSCGAATEGKLLFAWSLDSTLRKPLLAAAAKLRGAVESSCAPAGS